MEAKSSISALAELLCQRSTAMYDPTAAAASNKTYTNEREKDQNLPTIFDLSNDDRCRILKLIEELLDAQEEGDKLRQKLDEEKAGFREKRSTLMKKLDLLSEKHERSQSIIEAMKDKHQQSLMSLEEKVSTVSLKLETSMEEIRKLRRANAELKKENMDLRKLNSETTTSASAFQLENSKLNLQVETNRYREKSLKREIKRLGHVSGENSDFKANKEGGKRGSSLSFLFPLDHLRETSHPRSVTATKEFSHNKPNLCEGAGDFITQQPSSTGVNTIKAPDKAKFGQNVPSTAAFVCKSNSDDDTSAQRQNISFDNQAHDIALLENLFFRF